MAVNGGSLRCGVYIKEIVIVRSQVCIILQLESKKDVNNSILSIYFSLILFCWISNFGF